MCVVLASCLWSPALVIQHTYRTIRLPWKHNLQHPTRRYLQTHKPLSFQSTCTYWLSVWVNWSLLCTIYELTFHHFQLWCLLIRIWSKPSCWRGLDMCVSPWILVWPSVILTVGNHVIWQPNRPIRNCITVNGIKYDLQPTKHLYRLPKQQREQVDISMLTYKIFPLYVHREKFKCCSSTVETESNSVLMSTQRIGLQNPGRRIDFPWVHTIALVEPLILINCWSGWPV